MNQNNISIQTDRPAKKTPAKREDVSDLPVTIPEFNEEDEKNK